MARNSILGSNESFEAGILTGTQIIGFHTLNSSIVRVGEGCASESKVYFYSSFLSDGTEPRRGAGKLDYVIGRLRMGFGDERFRVRNRMDEEFVGHVKKCSGRLNQSGSSLSEARSSITAPERM